MNFGPYVMGVKLKNAFVDELYDRGNLKNDASKQSFSIIYKKNIFIQEKTKNL